MRFYIKKWETESKSGEVITVIKEVGILHWVWYHFVTLLALDVPTKYTWGR